MDAKKSALKIVQRLNQAGYVAYFAGGWVRDYLLGHPSSDIDIATDASSEEILKLFPRTVKVGISFGVVIVLIDENQFEVSTFRKDLGYEDGRRPKKIEHSSAKEDALRRDFTINGMFFDPLQDQVIDYVGGQEDLKKKIIRTIGDPSERFREDRLRMIRAVRFACRFGYTIDPETETAIQENAATLLPAVSMERIWQEIKKMAEFPTFGQALRSLHRLGLLQVIFPVLNKTTLRQIDARIASFPYFSKDSPAILLLLELFPGASLKEQVALCQYLKVSGKNQKLVEEAERMRQLIARGAVEEVEWARFHALENSPLLLEAIAARMIPGERDRFLQEHRARVVRLKPHTERVVGKRPLVTAGMLQNEGIKPGKIMGILLAEAERLAINQDLHDPSLVIKELKRSPLWPEILHEQDDEANR